MDELRKAFENPPATFRPQPFWFLNHFLDEELLRVQIAEMADKGVGGVVLHPRHGLKEAFLGEEWMRAIEVCLAELKRHGMEAWIYDEDNWPSGYFGGRITRRNPDLRMRYLRVQALRISGGATYQTRLEVEEDELIAALAAAAVEVEGGEVVPGEPVVDVRRFVHADGTFRWAAPPGEWLVVFFWERPVPWGVTFFDGSYLDTLNPEAVKEFIRACYEPQLRFRDYFGDVIKGVFTDEPGMMIHDAYFSDAPMAPTVEEPGRRLSGIVLPWTRGMFERFRELKGYDLREHLLDLVFDVSADSDKVKVDYFEAVSSWYVEAYHGQLSAWCEEHGLEYTGHTLEDPFANQVRTQGNQLRILELMHRPGYDYLGHGIGDRQRPSRLLAIKCAASAARLAGRRRVAVEAFGAARHANTLANRRLDLNLMAVLGTNMVIPHGFYYSVAGVRGTDFPPDEFYHAPFWPMYRQWADYIGRVCLFNCQGERVAPVAVMLPVKTFAVRMVRNGRIERQLPQQWLVEQVSDRLLRLHVDYDYVDESHLERARVEGGELCYDGVEARHSVVVLPGVEIISRYAAEKLVEFFEAGGKILAIGTLPTDADRRGDDEAVREAIGRIFSEGDERRRWGESEAGGEALFVADPGEDVQAVLEETVGQWVEREVEVEPAEDGEPAEDVFCQHRSDGARHYIMLFNTRQDRQVAVSVRTPRAAMGRLERWDFESGRQEPVAATERQGRLAARITLGPGELVGLVFDPASLPEPPARGPGRVVDKIELSEAWAFEARGPNVLVLDEFRFVARDMELAEKLGEAHVGQVNSYTTTFRVEGKVRGLRLVFDEPYPDVPAHIGFLDGLRDIEVFLNGQRLPAPQLSTWMDPYYMEIEIDDFVREGENELKIAIMSLLSPMKPFFSPVWLVGQFEVDGRTVRPARRQMMGLWNENGYPNYSGVGAYSQSFEVPQKYAVGARLFLKLSEVHECCRVLVNGEEAGVRLWAPWRVELTGLVRPGRNELTVEVANTAANLYDKRPLPSGLAGPAWIEVCER